MKDILNRDKELYKNKDAVCKIISGMVWGKVQKQEIDRRVMNFIEG